MTPFTFTPRSPHESHRVATTLELMFDLASVIAIAAAAAGLHHAVAANHALDAFPAFLGAFFMIWWSWMNYTWFASAYDDGSAGFHILSLMAMFGALAIAAGIPAVFAGQPIYLSLLGFVIMRVAMALLWFGAAAGDPAHRRTATTYGIGIIAMQAYWIALVLAIGPQSPLYTPLFVAGIAGELSVPAIAEFRHGATSWHRHHIIERYGLLNIIVLGESFLAVVAMLARDDRGTLASGHGILSAVTAAAIAFSMWGVYFTRDAHLEDDRLPRALLWGYGHFAIFAAGAATGAGFAVFHEVATGHAEAGYRTASLAIAIPIAIYMAGLWLVRDRFCLNGWPRWILPIAAVALLLVPLVTAEALPELAVIAVVTAFLRRRAGAAA
ncbi:low temperature requirement protein A [Sphingomonas sp.]|uniref:low temperature requirement protein A n=1 Tax=Sphingomonas sp. TaxID=28214 RepID=UPI001EC3B870|nr:low temperature requirement protein A [Sphingomonas sp.]MBX3593371.1 low temperature requirement protein A [Sphingomonas sp.]